MNIFILQSDPVKAAQDLCDKHVVKMALETAQLLCSPFESGVAPYKRTHYNHPCSKWVRESKANYEWLLKHGFAICAEYTHRYGKVHACEKVIRWCKNNYNKLKLPSIQLTKQPLAMPDQYKSDDVVISYRNYYKYVKKGFATWKNRQQPAWF